MHELRRIALQSGRGPWYFANVSYALCELVRGPVSTLVDFNLSSSPWDSLAYLEKVRVSSRDVSSQGGAGGEEEEEEEEEEEYICKGEVMQRIAQGLFASRVREE